MEWRPDSIGRRAISFWLTGAGWLNSVLTCFERVWLAVWGALSVDRIDQRYLIANGWRAGG